MIINRQQKIGLIVAGLVLLLVFGLVAYNKNRPGNENRESISNTALRALTPEDKQDLEADLTRLEAEEKNLPQDPEERYDFYLQLARVRYELGKNKDAIETLDKVVKEKGDYIRPGRMWFLYAKIYNESQYMDRAIESIKKAVEAEQDREDYWLTYIGFSGQNDPNLDLSNLYKEALDKTKNNPDILGAYARYLAFKGQKDQAIAQWQKAIEVDPANKPQYDAEIQKLQTP